MSFDQDGIGARLDSKIQKLIILFVFDRMAISLSESALLDICTSENDWLSYMDCKQYLGELIDTNLLYRVPKSDYINITQDGIGCLALFFSRIPTSIRDDINTYARENRMRYKKRQSYFCDYSKNADGTYTVIMKIVRATAVDAHVLMYAPPLDSGSFAHGVPAESIFGGVKVRPRLFRSYTRTHATPARRVRRAQT